LLAGFLGPIARRDATSFAVSASRSMVSERGAGPRARAAGSKLIFGAQKAKPGEATPKLHGLSSASTRLIAAGLPWRMIMRKN
jgi:hypothetical protein